MNEENNKNIDELSDDEFIEMGLFIDDVDLGKIPLINPDDSEKVKRRKEKIIDERIDDITKTWDIYDEEASNSILRKIIYDISDEVSRKIKEREEKKDRISKILIRRLRALAKT